MSASSNSGGEEGAKESRSKFSILAPSKFSFDGSKSVSSGFTGLKASKFNFGAPQKKDVRDFGKEKEEEKKEDKSEADNMKKADSVSFLPLTKNNESSDSSSHKTDGDDGPSIGGVFTFGEKIESRIENTSSKSGFTFGENLKDRFAKDATITMEESLSAPDTTAGASSATTTPTKTTQPPESNYFKTSGTASSSSNITNSPNALKNGSKKSLSEAAADYEESHAIKRKYEEVTVKTGEEDESNIIQLPAKLHTFDNAKRNWSEKGRGILRLNDMNDTSRLVMRSVGVLKVTLNTKLFAGMSWERPSEKSIRFSGADDEGGVKIFLLTGSAKDMDRLFQLTQTRLNSLQNKKAKQSP
ncbi:ran-binding protein 3 [Lepeophtheirus salmonis]|uniref:ran-binding protein 3 n=1 Tax=Lepeophtheirus salmonis TaxID=72036 RepID=UPI001AE1214C|nr:ran-binding protein 3-like [Lepeophtheirus salmonis]